MLSTKPTGVGTEAVHCHRLRPERRGRIEQLRLLAIALGMVSTAASVHISGADFMSTSPMGANKPIEDIEASLLATTKSALDEFVSWAHATIAAKAVEA